MRSVELFSGCGGLALGTARAGFKHEGMVEWNEDACATLAHNKARKLEHIRDWRFQHADVKSIDWTKLNQEIHMVAGGSGLSDGVAGLRLRYEFTRQFAPYVGVERAGKFGKTADLARAAGEKTDETRWVAGVRFWF